MRVLVIAAIAALVAACQTTTGVLPAGQDAYSITTSASGGAGGITAAKKAAYEQANTACGIQKKTMAVTSENETLPTFFGDGMATISLRFKCEK